MATLIATSIALFWDRQARLLCSWEPMQPADQVGHLFRMATIKMSRAAGLTSDGS